MRRKQFRLGLSTKKRKKHWGQDYSQSYSSALTSNSLLFPIIKEASGAAPVISNPLASLLPSL